VIKVQGVERRTLERGFGSRHVAKGTRPPTPPLPAPRRLRHTLP
jgi:hypothetical protein